MARFSEEELSRIKEGVDLVALVRSKGIELSGHGSADLKGLCPFHDDKDPSMIVSPKKNLFHCMSCGEGGSVIDFVMKYDGLSFRHAVELLKDKPPSLYKSGVLTKRSRSVKLKSPLQNDMADQQLYEQVLSYYHKSLCNSAEAVAYLSKRGISAEAIKHFNIGYADRSLSLRLPGAQRKEGHGLRERLKKLGLIRSSGHEHFNGSVVFPIVNAGRVEQIYGRKIRNNLREGTAYHLYLPGRQSGVFNIESLKHPEVILCESIIDALSYWCCGVQNVTSIYGTQGFTQELFDALIAHKVQKVYIGYDNDASGHKAADRDAERLSAHGIRCYRIHYPSGLDANAYAMASGDNDLKTVITAAEPLLELKLHNKSTVPLSLAAKDAAKEEKGMNGSGGLLLEGVELTEQGEDLHAQLGERHYRIRGLSKNQSLDVLKVNLRLMCNGHYYLDTLDLMKAKERQHYISAAASEVKLTAELVKRDLGKLLLKLEEHQSAAHPSVNEKPATPSMTAEEKQEALRLLKDPKLLERILADFELCGIVGEATNKLTGYLACVSRKLDKPLAVIIQSTSAAGKSTLMESILDFFPEEERIKYSAMTGQSLYYLGESDLRHKILAIVEEEGAEKASYALKLLQSEGELTIASTGKDDQGRMKTEEYHVEGPVMIFLTTTAIDIDEELLNRCLILTVDEGGEQTGAIHRLQRESETFVGLKKKVARSDTLRVHRNAQKLLKPVKVVNPYALYLSFRSDRTRFRRDHMKYLTLIRTIALLHQYQRQMKQHKDYSYIEVSLEDIEVANRITQEILSRSLDELSPQGQGFLEQVVIMVEDKCKKRSIDRGDCRFTRRAVRQYTGMSEYQVRHHMQKLTELEYVRVHHGGYGSSYIYELVHDGRDEAGSNKMCLADVGALRLAEKKHCDA